MAFALVGSAGVATQGAVTTAVTPAWGAGSSRTAGNLLICFVSVTGVATLATTPSGWTQGSNQAGASCSAVIFYKNAAGGDAAPTIASITGGVIAAHLEEWSGVQNPVTNIRLGSTVGTVSPVTATLAPGADTETGWLVVMAGADFRSAARTPNDTWTSNNGTPTLRASNNAVSSVNHYSHATMVATSNAAADTAVMTCSVTTSITGLVISAYGFRPSTTTPATGTGAGTGTASSSGGTAAETISGTGASTGTAATASGTGSVGSAGATGTGAGTQAAQTASGTGLEAITGSGVGTQVAQSGAGTATLALTGTGAGSQALQTATGSGSSLVAVAGTGAGAQTTQSATGDGVQVFAGGGNQVPQSGYGEGTVEGGVEVPPSVEGSTIFAPKLRVIAGGGGGVQARQTAKGRGTVNDDDLVVMAA